MTKTIAKRAHLNVREKLDQLYAVETSTMAPAVSRAQAVAIWEDFRTCAKDLPIPDQHRELLDARQSAVAEGRERVRAWNVVKRSLRPPRQ